MTSSTNPPQISEGEEKLGFEIVQRGTSWVIAWPDAGCRPATSSEVALWSLISSLRADKQRLDWLEGDHDRGYYRPTATDPLWHIALPPSEEHEPYRWAEGATLRECIDAARSLIPTEE